LLKTNLNYYILDKEKRVFLLQNSMVYDGLPGAFLDSKDSAQVENSTVVNRNVPPPAFYTEPQVLKSNRTPLVRIGKADKQNLRPEYILSGKVVNVTTKDPIPDLAIRVKGKNRVTVTDEQGNYELRLSAGYNLIATSAMGIQDTERELMMYNDGILNLALGESLEQLDE